MKNFKLETNCGNTFDGVAEKAKQIADEKDITVEFDFNGTLCIVTKDTNLEWLWKDYTNSHHMEWKQVTGIGEYPKEIQDELNARNKLAEEKQAKEQKKYDNECKLKRELYESKVEGITIELSNSDLWKEYCDKNTDPYGKCCVDYAESWAKLMQVEISKGKSVKDCAEDTSYQLGFYGITGFMYGAAVSMLSTCWKHGEELRKWHNKEYDGDGVVNPAIISINTKN